MPTYNTWRDGLPYVKPLPKPDELPWRVFNPRRAHEVGDPLEEYTIFPLAPVPGTNRVSSSEFYVTREQIAEEEARAEAHNRALGKEPPSLVRERADRAAWYAKRAKNRRKDR